jgi:hypothetical protein
MRSRRLAAVATLLLAAVAAILLLPRDTDTWLGLVAAAGIWAPRPRAFVVGAAGIVASLGVAWGHRRLRLA